MRKILFVVAVGILAFGVAGCNEDKKVNTVEFYQKDDSARAAVIKKCESANKLSASEMADCENAKRAEYLIGESKPIDLSGVSKK